MERGTGGEVKRTSNLVPDPGNEINTFILQLDIFYPSLLKKDTSVCNLCESDCTQQKTIFLDLLVDFGDNILLAISDRWVSLGKACTLETFRYFDSPKVLIPLPKVRYPSSGIYFALFQNEAYHSIKVFCGVLFL